MHLEAYLFGPVRASVGHTLHYCILKYKDCLKVLRLDICKYKDSVVVLCLVLKKQTEKSHHEILLI